MGSELCCCLGTMSTEGGYSSLQEQKSAIGIPIMTNRSFMKTEKAVCGGEKWKLV